MKKSFSLIELLVAMGMLTILGAVSLSLFVTLTENRRRIELENTIQIESRILFDRITREIRRNMIDYGEYYNRAVLSDAASIKRFGENINTYASLFFNRGSDNELGATCNDGTPAPCSGGATIDTSTIDVDTGQNPWVAPGNLPEDANAFCNNDIPGKECSGRTSRDYIQSQLYLIDPTGSQKTIIGLENLGSPNIDDPVEFAISMIKLNGTDADGDGVRETWTPTTYFTGANTDALAAELEWLLGDTDESLPRRTTTEIHAGARPITPLNFSIDRLSFEIIPREDPLRAWDESETESDMQIYPSVRVRMQIRPSALLTQGMTFAPLNLQTIVTPETHVRLQAGEFTASS